MRPDPLVRAGVALGGVTSVLLPILAWLAPGGELGMVLASVCALTAGGTGIAALTVGHSRALFAATAPAVSVAVVMIVSVAQVLLDMWSPPTTAGVVGMIGAASAVAWFNRNPGRGLWAPPLRTALPLLALFIALGLWAWAVRRLDLDSATGAGIISVLPWQYFAALVVLAGTAAFLVQRKVQHWLLFATGAVLAIIITLTVNIADGGAVMGTGYVHVGFADAIADRGALLLGTDARFSWPAFFTTTAVVGAWAGLPSTSGLALIYPAVITICYLPAIVTIGKALTGSAATGWLGALLFITANWGQQDYFSPQSAALLLYLAITAVVLHEMAHTSVTPGTLWQMVRRTPARPDGWSANNVIAAEALLILLATALIIDHQLTPVALIAALAAWSLLGRTRHRSLWFGVGVIFAIWFAFGAYDWWTGHLQILIDGIGKPQNAISSGLSDRVRGDELYAAMQLMRIGWSAFFALGGAVGWLLLRGRFPLAAAAVPVAAPIALVFGQSYGGEVILRVFLYASPFLAVLTAHAIRTALARIDRVAVPVLAVVILLSGVAGATARGVNVFFERTPVDVLVAAREVLAIAPSGATVRPLALEGSLRTDRVGELRQPSTLDDPDAEPFTNLMRQRPDYVFLTTTREAYEHIVNGQPADWYPDIARRLVRTKQYREFWRSDHVIVLERITSSDLPISEDPGVPAIPEGN
ncbi:hypothetical protein KRX51_06870 [Corynebacterium sp. TAE3-ERU12]|uniref:hypothetical protein n=1 Tax=Corynebacterium sp. TAE3-ERU12 TaxID=2849491 RepID=UPI001C446D5B|nr:hypothetical protein [Corynebacterium sp. TAE3-ERU12]MBV7295639.1 hypothetical protein [Corynebacterium sp. TAE3-ERU12]